MQVIIPAAGYGSRMRPHTHTRAKPLLHVAGKPCIDYILDEVEKLDNVSEVILIVGHLGDQIEEYLRKRYKFNMRFLEQKVLDGQVGAIRLAKDFVNEDVLIIFSDTLFDVDLSEIKKTEADGLTWAKEVEDFSRFGIVIKDDKGFMKEIIEKPNKPYTKLANIGMHWIKNYKLMFKCMDEQYKKRMQTKGEYYLTDTITMMIAKGEKWLVPEVKGWYDTGKPETTFETQKILLEKRHKVGKTENTKVIGNVYIEDGAVVKDSTIGPNVSIGTGTIIKNSEIRDSIIGIDSEVRNSKINESLIGDCAKVVHASGKINIGDHSEIVHENNT